MAIRASTPRGSIRLSLFAVMVAALSIIACSESALFSPNRNDATLVALRPFFAVQPNASAGAAVNRIRATVFTLPERTLAGTRVVDVDPADASWPLDLEVPGNTRVEVLIELINVTGNVETVEYSGTVTVTVTTGPQGTPAPVPVFPGPPENLNITSVAITPRSLELLEGESRQLQASVTGGPANPTVAWSSANPAVATVDASGNITAVAPGQAVITVQAGPRSDNITVAIGARATRVDVTPAAPVLASFGADVTLTGRVLDSRNNEISGLPITWTIADATIATQVGPNVFRARRNGTTVVTGTAVQNGREVTGTATLKVEQRAVSITLTPASATLTSFGETRALQIAAKDANGNDVSGLAFTWTSSNPAVATVDANGVVTALANGATTIKAANAGASAEAAITVQQTPASLTISPTDATLRSLDETVQFRVEMKDARGNIMTAPVTWTTSLAGVASVDANGLVTATGDGAAVIGATVGGQRANATVYVERVPARIALNETERELQAGTTFQLIGTVVDANGFAIDGHAITWSSNKPAVATVSSTGNVHGVSAGDAEITARSGFAFGVARFKVKGTSTGFHIANGRVLLYHAEGSFGANQLKNRLVATGVFTADKIDELEMTSTIPTLATLSQYGCVLTWTDFGPPNPVAQGDRLKEYVDAGGKVVIAVYAYSRSFGTPSEPSRPWQLQGGIMQTGYSPFMLVNGGFVPLPDGTRTGNMTTALTSHPIMEGVSSFTYSINSNYAAVAIDQGATVVIHDHENIPIVGVSQSGRVVGFNLWPMLEDFHGPQPSKSQIDRALANACR